MHSRIDSPARENCSTSVFGWRAGSAVSIVRKISAKGNLLSTTSLPRTTDGLQRTPRSSRWPWIAAGVAVLLLLVVHFVIASFASLPVYWEDEAGYLGNAQVMAGVGHVPDLRGRPYYLGWSLLLVPFWWIFQDGQSVYIAGVFLSAVCGVATAIPLALIARRLRVSWPWSIVAGAVIAISPAHSLLSGFGLPENFLTLLVAFSALFAFKFHDNKSLGNAIGLGLFVAGSFTVHGRVIPVVIATGLWFLFTMRRSLIPSIVGLVSMVAVSGAGFLLYKHVTTLIYGPGGARESVGIGRIIHADFFSTLMSGIGQAWYLVFGTVGLAILGVIALWRQLVLEYKARTPGLATWALLGILGMSIISFTSISAAIERGSSRLDIYSYGRYLDPIFVPIALVGLVLVIRGLSRRLALGLLISTAAVGALWFLIVFPNRSTDGTKWWAPINITGTLQYGWHWNERIPSAPWSVGTIFVILALIVVYFLRKRPAIVVALLLVFFGLSSAYAEARVMRPFFEPWQQSFTLRANISADPLLEGVPVAFDMDDMKEIGDVASKNAYQILLAPTYVPIFDSTDTKPTTQLVISRQDWEYADKYGAKKIANDTGVFSNALWVMPGELQDKLAAEGKLIANDSTTATP